MNSFRKWLYRPRKDDPSLFAQFYYADENLDIIASELDSFDGRVDPEKCTALVNQLRQCQNRILNIWFEMMDELFPNDRAIRDYRVKFPDEVMQEDLSGQLWFAAECLVAGNIIMNREVESSELRPIARGVTKTIETVRNLLREQCLKPIPEYTEDVVEYLRLFDTFFGKFEYGYVSAMVPVKTSAEYENQQNVVVLFSETLQRALKMKLILQEDVDNYDPVLMFTIPRLAIVCGLFVYPDGPLNIDRESKQLSELFRPFKGLLLKIRELLCTMTAQELLSLEKCLCSMDQPEISLQKVSEESSISPSVYGVLAYNSDFIKRFYANYPSCRQLTPELTFLCPSKKSERLERKRSKRTRDRPLTQNERFLCRLTGAEERPRSRRKHKRDHKCESRVEERSSRSHDRHDDQCNASVTHPHCNCSLRQERALYGNFYRALNDMHNDRLEFFRPSERLPQSEPFNPDLERSDYRPANIGDCVTNVVSADPTLLSPNSIISPEEYPQASVDFERLPSEFSRLSVEPKEHFEEFGSPRFQVDEEPQYAHKTQDESSGSTSPHHSGTEDDEEVALALQAAEVAATWRVRERFSDSKDLIHRLFVCISGVADQLQTNYASDLRNILKSVFLMNQTVVEEEDLLEQAGNEDISQHSINSEELSVESAEDALVAIEASDSLANTSDLEDQEATEPNLSLLGIEATSASEAVFEAVTPDSYHTPLEECPQETFGSETPSEATAVEDVAESNRRCSVIQEPPPWILDHMASRCMACGASFTVVRRRHHCRNCGKIFCGHCSSHFVPLPHFGIWKNVRVCNGCFLQYVTSSTTTIS